jgi:hypothetical protein
MSAPLSEHKTGHPEVGMESPVPVVLKLVPNSKKSTPPLNDSGPMRYPLAKLGDGVWN